MIAGNITEEDGVPKLDGKQLAPSSYNPSEEVRKLFAQVQADYLNNWSLQNRPFNEFDQLSLLQRTNIDQQTFGAFVGAIFLPATQSWRWRGRKNTARNKIMGLLAHMIAGMLFPYTYAYNDEDKEDELGATVMRTLIEAHLKKANYDVKYMFFCLSALVNPAVFVEIEYVEAMQKIKSKLKDGTYKIEWAVDELLSGIGLNNIPIDSILLGDFFTFDLQRQPNIARVRRISYDEARSIYAKKYFLDEKDQFDYVEAGKTKIIPSGNSKQIIYDIDMTIADANFVQEITMYYRPEDLEVTFVGGVFMGNSKDVYNSNCFKHRRMSMIGNEYKSIPVYPFAKTGFEPIDPNGRFAYYKSASFKEFWDDASINKMYQLWQDGGYLDIIKPMFGSGVASLNADAMVPGNFIGMPTGATVTPYQLGPNLGAAMQLVQKNESDMSLSTQSSEQGGVATPGVTATASIKAEQNAKIMMTNMGLMIVDLIRQIGELVGDDIIMHTTVGEVDATVPESLTMKYRTIRLQTKEDGRDVTKVVEFDSSMMNQDFTKEKAEELEWKMFEESGGKDSKNIRYKVNPYKFARLRFSYFVDPGVFISRSLGTDKLRNDRAVAIMTSPAIAPYINMPEVVRDFIVKDYSNGDPDKYLKTEEDIQMEQQRQQMQGTKANGGLANTMLSQPATAG